MMESVIGFLLAFMAKVADKPQLREIKGRTRLQKIVFLAQAISKVQIASFRAHYYGPYSEEISVAISYCNEMDLINETIEHFNDENGHRAQLVRYNLSITSDGRKVLENNVFEEPQSNLLDAAMSVAFSFSESNVLELSIAAKVCYVLTSESSYQSLISEDKLKEKMVKLKWKVDDKDYENAVRKLIELKLVEKA